MDSLGESEKGRLKKGGTIYQFFFIRPFYGGRKLFFKAKFFKIWFIFSFSFTYNTVHVFKFVYKGFHHSEMYLLVLILLFLDAVFIM